jgi:hypothetical protein
MSEWTWGLFLAHIAATLFMTGLIWFVQIVHYPLFRWLPPAAFVAYEQKHTRLTGRVVGAPMLIELGTGLVLIAAPAMPERSWFLASLILLGIVWVTTAIFQIPQHRRLSVRHDAECIDQLVRTNWIRTIAWTARALILLWIAFRAGGAS